jgi:ubiquinone/menaquinone biosynthesis C-methylase UbiE
MTLSTYEPPPLEIGLTLALGLTVLSPYYRSFARSLDLSGDELVLDFGSGSGICSRHIAALLKRCGHLDCVDISSGWMNVIRKTLRDCNNVSYHLGSITQLDLPASAFDVVVLHFVLHDISATERQSVVNALARRLKPGGRLLLREPQGEGLSPEELLQLASTAGLSPSIFRSRKVAVWAVIDACFIRPKGNS